MVTQITQNKKSSISFAPFMYVPFLVGARARAGATVVAVSPPSMLPLPPTKVARRWCVAAGTTDSQFFLIDATTGEIMSDLTAVAVIDKAAQAVLPAAARVPVTWMTLVHGQGLSLPGQDAADPLSFVLVICVGKTVCLLHLNLSTDPQRPVAFVQLTSVETKSPIVYAQLLVAPRSDRSTGGEVAAAACSAAEAYQAENEAESEKH